MKPQNPVPSSTVKIDGDLYRLIKARAVKNERSMAQEVRKMLKEQLQLYSDTINS